MSCQNQVTLLEHISPSPIWGKLASRGGIQLPSAVSARRIAEEGHPHAHAHDHAYLEAEKIIEEARER